MAIAYVNEVGQAQSKTSGTTLVIPSTNNASSGNLVIVTFACDDVSGTFSIADDQSNSWREVINVLNSGNVRLIVWASIVGASGITGNITVTHPTATARCGDAQQYSGVASSTEDQETSATGGTQAMSVGPITPTESGELVFAAQGAECESTDLSAESDWGSGFSGVGTTGAGAASNISTKRHYEIQTSPTARTYAYSNLATRDWAAVIVSFKATGGAPSAIAPPLGSQIM